MALLVYLDVVLVVVAAPIMLLIGVPASGYLPAAGAWIVLRAAAVGVDRWASTIRDPRREVPLRLVFLIARLFLLAIAIIIVRKAAGRDPGITALAVIVFAYTVSLATSFANRPGRR